MSKSVIYLLDSDVFIAAKNTYYAFDICPGFWAAVLREHANGRVFSVNRVRGELLTGSKEEDLVQWVSNQVPSTFFKNVDEGPVSAMYAQIMLWSQRHTRYSDAAKAKFATGADAWLVAYAKVHGAIVVTNEQPAPDSKREIKLPDVCVQFNLRPEGTFSMLRNLGVEFGLHSKRAI
jgi:hypothetical protein